MKKVKVFLGIKDNAFSEKLKKLSGNVEILENTKGAELLFLDRIPPNCFYGVRTKGVIVASKYSRRKEFLAARSGAKAFLTKDMTKTNLLKAIKVISNGEIWMTRIAIAGIFEEYVKMITPVRKGAS